MQDTWAFPPMGGTGAVSTSSVGLHSGHFLCPEHFSLRVQYSYRVIFQETAFCRRQIGWNKGKQGRKSWWWEKNSEIERSNKSFCHRQKPPDLCTLDPMLPRQKQYLGRSHSYLKAAIVGCQYSQKAATADITAKKGNPVSDVLTVRQKEQEETCPCSVALWKPLWHFSITAMLIIG